MSRLQTPVLAVLLVAALGAQAAGQGVPEEVQRARTRGLPLASCLQDAAALARAQPLEAVRRAVGPSFVAIDDAGRVHVELVAPPGASALRRTFVTPFGGQADTRWRDRLDAWIPLDTIEALAAALPSGHRVERASAGSPDEVTGEGPAAIGSDGYRNGGANGTGVTIALIDAGFTALGDARGSGDAPPLSATTLVNYTPTAFETGGDHGTACVEAAFDHCPGATWRLYKIDSVADMGTAVSDAIAHGVDVISHSLSRYNLGWADDSGGACAAALQAANAGIVLFTSAGNRAEQHWQGTFTAGGGTAARHDWAAGDESLGIQMPAGEGAEFYLSWNTGAGSADYDLLLYDASMTSLLASSTAGTNVFESFAWGNTGTAPVTVNLVVERISGATLELEVFGHGSGAWEHVVGAGSTTSPSNTTHYNVISVGAVDWSDFASAPGATGILQAYSGRGPSNSGMTLPDLVGPTNTQGFLYPAAIGGFGGTSCATPNAAGALVAHWSSVPAFGTAAERWLHLEQARLRRDWGSGGQDDQYGWGGCSLAPFAANTVWLARGYGNTANLPIGPLYTLPAAYAAVTSGGRILALPGGYSEQLPLTLTKAHRIEGWGGGAVVAN